MIGFRGAGNQASVLQTLSSAAATPDELGASVPPTHRGSTVSQSGVVSLPRIISTPPPRQTEARLLRLVERVKEDDLVAFEELYKLTRDDVARTLFHLVGNRPDLEDLVQETYLRLLKSVRGFRGDAQFKTFLYRVCANVAFMHLRWWRRRREDLMDEVPECIAAGDPERAAQSSQALRLVQQALSKLTPKKRVVFVYHELLGMGPEEIAEAVGATYNTVRSRLHHARAEFTAAMSELTGEEVAS